MTILNARMTKQTIKNGSNYDKNLIKVLELELGVAYKVKAAHVGRTSTDVLLEDFPGYRFNSVNFEFMDSKNTAVDIINDVHPRVSHTYIVPWNHGTKLQCSDSAMDYWVESTLDTSHKL